MAYTEYKYTCRIDGEGAFACDMPFIVVKLHHGGRAMKVTALIDSGCTTTHIRTDIADALGIDLSKAKEKNSSGITGTAIGKHFKMTIEIEGHGKPFETPIACLSTLPVAMLLGQDNFFDKFNVKFEKNKNSFFIERNR